MPSTAPSLAPFAQHKAQIAAILRAWTMTEAAAEETAEILGYADLHGIDSHGMSMLPPYDVWRSEGRLNMQARPSILRETPVSALIDGDGGLGHVPGAFAMRTAIQKAKTSGVGITAVRNTSHFGACGYYGMMAVNAGLIGMVTTSTPGVRVAPTFGAEPRLGTDPWCFAVPAEPGRPFLLDMATTTVAYGRVRNKANENLSTPQGWVVDAQGNPSTDPRDVTEKPGFLTSLGGAPEASSYKGYGLAMMADILAAGLAGESFPSSPDHAQGPRLGMGHFFMAFDPGLFREPADFNADIARFCAEMRATPPIDPAKPVMVAGDPERATAARRTKDGVPVGPGLLAQIKALAADAGAPWLL